MRCPACNSVDTYLCDNVTDPIHAQYICRNCGSQFTDNVDPERRFDQTAKQDDGKLKLTLVPTQIIRDIAEVREYGNNKYGDKDNWKTVEPERYRDALYRHFLAYLEDPSSIDEESGIPHYKHMACNMAFLCEMEAQRIRKRRKKTKRG